MSARRGWLAFAALATLAIAWFWRDIGYPAAHADDTAYLEAFGLVERGESPYGAARYLYTPVFARAGAAALHHLGFRATAIGMRLAIVLAGCVLVWTTVTRCRLPPRARLPVALLVVLGFRPLGESVSLGNLSPVSAALLVVPLVAFARMPVLAGLAFAVGVAIKPAALPALAVLAADRSVGSPRSRLVTIVTAALASLVLFSVDARYLPQLVHAGELLDAPSNLAPFRILAALGLRLPVAVLAALVTAGCSLWVYRSSRGERGLLVAAGLASVLWLPRVWLHSLSVLLPAVLFAGDRAWRGFRATGAGRDPRSRRALLVLAWTALGITVVNFADACADLGRVFPGLPWNPALHALIPLGAAVALGRFAAGGDREPSPPD